MVYTISRYFGRCTNIDTCYTDCFVSPLQSDTGGETEGTPVTGETDVDGLPLFARAMRAAGFSQQVVNTMQLSRRTTSNRLYKTYLDRWENYCDQREIDPVRPGVHAGVEFLQSLLEDKQVTRGYSAINTARSALSAVIQLESGGSFGDHPYVRVFMKGVFNKKPPTPRYVTVWDPEIVLKMLKGWSPAHKLTLRKLTLKLIMLILLVTGQRGQILLALNMEAMEINNKEFKFKIKGADLKQGRRGYKPEILRLKAFPADKRICVHRYLSVYLQRTEDIRGTEKAVILTTTKPHHKVSRDTISRWVKTVLSKAGIDMKEYGPGSTRAAAVSKAKHAGASVDEILKGGGMVYRDYLLPMVQKGYCQTETHNWRICITRKIKVMF